jgi:DTW domain-containing protein YfiP
MKTTIIERDAVKILSRIVSLLLLLTNDYCHGMLLQQQQQQTGGRFAFCSSAMLKGEDGHSLSSSSFLIEMLKKTNKENSSSNENEENEERNDSWSHLLSSPEKYAHALNMTIAQVHAVQQQRRRANQELQDALSRIKKHRKQSSSCSDGAAAAAAADQQCHFLVCQYRYRHGKHPFVCRSCWSYQPICICAQQQQKVNLPSACRDVILWTHHEEWGSPSNTGSVLSVMFQNHVQLWMKGYHDLEMHNLLKDDTIVPVLLWPSSSSPTNGNNDHTDNLHDDDVEARSSTTPSPYPLFPHVLTTIHELQALVASDDKKQIVLIAMEGTWRQARRLVSKFPRGIPRLSVTPAAFIRIQDNENNTDMQDKPQQYHSILHPLRRQRSFHHGGDDHPHHHHHHHSNKNNMCTAEAVVAALQLLGMSIQDSDHVLDAVRLKVDRTRRYQGKPLRSAR